MAGRKAVGGHIYQVKITLKGIRPPIWRRVQVPGIVSLSVFHDVIQTIFCWTNSHLHQFLIEGKSYGRLDDFDEVMIDENTVTLAEVVGVRIKRFEYVYDFGDNWEHEIRVEKVIAGNSGSERPVLPWRQAAPATGGLRRPAGLREVSSRHPRSPSRGARSHA